MAHWLFVSYVYCGFKEYDEQSDGFLTLTLEQQPWLFYKSYLLTYIIFLYAVKLRILSLRLQYTA